MISATAIRMKTAGAMAAAVLGVLLIPQAADAAKIKNSVAVFSGLDKITGRTTSFDVYVDETVQFGALQVTPRVCFTHDDTEAQKIDGFVEVDEITLDRKIRRIFNGWMFAASPGLNAVDHPIYDVWLTGCKQSSDVPAPDETKSSADTSGQPVTEAKPENKPTTDTNGEPALDPNVDIGVDTQQ
ncbi:MAG TPA: DUF2155 domain-containing protein [Rhizobium sp.]